MKSTGFQWTIVLASALLFLLLFKTSQSMFLLLSTIWGVSVLIGKWVDAKPYMAFIPVILLTVLVVTTQLGQSSAHLGTLSQAEKSAFFQGIILIAGVYVATSYAGIWLGRFFKK